jgi:hypothetical protein
MPLHAYSNQVQDGKRINGLCVDTGAFMREALARYSSYKRNFAI